VDYSRFYTANVGRALAYEAPGGWMPTVDASVIRLHAGYPAPTLIPSVAIGAAVQRVLNHERDLPLHYAGSPATSALQRHVEAQMAARWSHVGAHSYTLITSGSAQAIDLIARTMLDRSACIVVESPTYMEALETFVNYTDDILCIPIDENGLRTDVLEAMLETRQQLGQRLPRLLYTVASFHNPSGTTLSLERRHHLLTLAERFDFIVVEDDAYGELAFAPAPVPLIALDHSGRVLYVGSLSKVVAPGLRIGWVTGPYDLIATMGRFKKDLGHPFAAAAVSTYLDNVDWSARMSMLRDAYRDRRNTMLAALAASMPNDVRWTSPAGGFFVWLNVPGVDTAVLLQQALRAGVSYVAGAHFYHGAAADRTQLRLSYSFVDPVQMTQGVRILADVIRTFRRD